MANRKSNYEWLRIFSMACIVLSHFAVHGVYEIGAGHGIPGIVLHELTGLGNLGVMLFIFVSCYFLVVQTQTIQQSFHKTVSMLITVIGYDLIIWLVVCLLTRAFIPRSFGKAYWFMRYYMLFMLFTPYLSYLMKILTPRGRESFLIGMTVFFGLTYTFGWFHLHIELERALLFLYSFVLMDVLREQSPHWLNDVKKGWLIISIALIGMVISQWCAFNDITFLGHVPAIDHTFRYFHPFMLMLAVGIFTVFHLSDLGQNQRVNWMASKMLGVYLIHEHAVVRPRIWKAIKPIPLHGIMDTLLISLSYSTIVFMSCVIITIWLDKVIEKILVLIE